MKKYLSNEVHSIETVSNTNPNPKSFRIEIPYNDKDKVMNKTFWPNGIALKVWRQHCVNQGVNLPGTGGQQQEDENGGS